MLDPGHFTDEIIIPALITMNLDSEPARQILLGTAIQESRLTYLRQLGGPALGLFQIEPRTHSDLYANYLAYRPEMREKLLYLGDRQHASLIYNLRYAAAVARLIYYRDPEALPEKDDIDGQARMWKRVYNTPQGHGTEAQYLANWNRYMT